MKARSCVLTTFVVLFAAGVAGYSLLPDRVGRLTHPLDYRDTIGQASRLHRMDPYLLSAVIYEESKFQARSTSRRGARGLMQVMPETGRWVAGKIGLKNYDDEALYNPQVNIEIGSWYLKFLQKTYRNDSLALAAYNAGLKNVDRWVKKSPSKSPEDVAKSIPFKETREFVIRVKRSHRAYRQLYPEAFDGQDDQGKQADEAVQ